MTTPKPTKRRRTRSPSAAELASNDASSSEDHRATRSTPPAGDLQPDEDDVQPGAADDQDRERIWDTVVDEYHDIITELPLEYQRTFVLLRELEDEQQVHTKSIRTSLETYLRLRESSSPNLSTETPPRTDPRHRTSDPHRSAGAPSRQDATERARASEGERNAKQDISKALELAMRSAEDKVNLALTLYESVDRHIQRLDTDLALYEDSLVIGLRSGTQPSHDAPSALPNSPAGPTTSLGSRAVTGSIDVEAGRGHGAADRGSDRFIEEREREKKLEWDRMKEVVKESNKGQAKEVVDRATLGMPIDPNEPRYCYCNQVSYGKMIACENNDCKREWFHLPCVGLDQAPMGDWYCDDCLRAMGKL
ncbi:hypothetical protein JCM10212_004197 [Sporobolomyces blumeae]